MPKPHITIVRACPECGGELKKRKKKADPESVFLGCFNFPECRFTAPYLSDGKALANEIDRLWGEIEKLDQLVNQLKADNFHSTDRDTQALYDHYIRQRKGT